MLRDEDGSPLQINIDLRVHGTEMDAFMRAHGLASLEQNEMARSVTGKGISPTYAACETAQLHIRYLPEVKRLVQAETDRLFASRKTGPVGVIKKEFPDLLLHRIDRALTPIPRTKVATPKAFERYCGRDTFWTRFKMKPVPDVVWCVFFTIHDGGIVLVRHLAATAGNEKEL